MTLSAQKEREIIPVNWKEIKEVAAKEPQRIKNLVLRLSADTPDTTLTPNERILAYYGQSYLTPDTEMEEGRKLDDLMNQGKYEECLAEAKELLEKASTLCETAKKSFEEQKQKTSTGLEKLGNVKNQND